MTGLHCTVAGDRRRPAIVFLHGFLGSGAEWEHVLPALSDRYYCVAPDLPGHGDSLALPPEAYSVEGAARALVELLDALEVERAALAGYSMGGRLALYLALRSPERWTGLILESASPGIESVTGRQARRRSDERMAGRLESGKLEAFVWDWYRQPLFASLARKERLLEEIVRARLRNDPAELARSLRGMGAGRQPSLWGELAGLEVPSVAIAGELDERYVRISRRMSQLAAGMRAVVVPEVGHNAHAEDPATYLASLHESLGSINLCP